MTSLLLAILLACNAEELGTSGELQGELQQEEAAREEEDDQATPQPIQLADYFPLQDGNEWILKSSLLPMTEDEAKVLRSYKVSNTDSGAYRLTVADGILIATTPPTNFFVTHVYYSANDLYERAIDLITPSEPTTTARECSYDKKKYESTTLQVSVKEVGVSVQTPVGKFDNCVKIETLWKIKNKEWRKTYEWLAPGFGIVKQQSTQTECHDKLLNDLLYELQEVKGPVREKLPGSG